MDKFNLNGTGFQELDRDEMFEINGGESLAYWLGYGVGRAGKFIADAFTSPPCGCP